MRYCHHFFTTCKIPNIYFSYLDFTKYFPLNGLLLKANNKQNFRDPNLKYSNLREYLTLKLPNTKCLDIFFNNIQNYKEFI